LLSLGKNCHLLGFSAVDHSSCAHFTHSYCAPPCEKSGRRWWSEIQYI